jgi:biopolymer transport protein ExbB
MLDVSMSILAAEEYSWFKILVFMGGSVGYLLWVMSVVLVALIIRYFINIRRTNIVPDVTKQQIQELFQAKQYREVIELTSQKADLLSYAIHSALKEAPHGYPAMERAMEEASEERTTVMLRSLEWLNLLGNIGPMLGLFGTVQGMIGAFFTIVKVGSPDPASLAHDIGIALVTTFLGLQVAIPALTVYAWMRNRVDALSSEAMVVAQEMISAFRPTARKQ